MTSSFFRRWPGALSLAMLLTLACLYSLGFLSASMATLEVGPYFAGAMRVVFASLFLLVVAYFSGAGLVSGKKLWVMASIYGTISMSPAFIILPAASPLTNVEIASPTFSATSARGSSCVLARVC